MSQQLDALKAQVAANTTVVQSAVALIQGLKVKLDEAIAANNNGDDGAALQALAAELGATDQALAAAVTANTPAAAPAAPVVTDPPVETPVPGSTDTPA